MIKKVILRKGVLQVEPDFEEDKVVFLNFDRKTNMESLKKGDEWEFKITSELRKIGKKDRSGKEMFHKYVLPIRRIEKWMQFNGKFNLLSGDNNIKTVKARKDVEKYILDKSLIREIGSWINPETGERSEMSRAIEMSEIDFLPDDVKMKIKANKKQLRKGIADCVIKVGD